jgi:hypothetical protein
VPLLADLAGVQEVVEDDLEREAAAKVDAGAVESSFAPCWRSIRTKASLTCRPASRRRSAVSKMLPPPVTRSSMIDGCLVHLVHTFDLVALARGWR